MVNEKAKKKIINNYNIYINICRLQYFQVPVPAMSDWGIALLVIVLVAVVAVALGVLFRLFGIYQLAWCLGSDEEKAGLTQHEKVHGFMVNI